jgi:hypothetical protein
VTEGLKLAIPGHRSASEDLLASFAGKTFAVVSALSAFCKKLQEEPET